VQLTGAKDGSITVTLPQVPEAITQRDNEAVEPSRKPQWWTDSSGISHMS